MLIISLPVDFVSFHHVIFRIVTRLAQQDEKVVPEEVCWKLAGQAADMD